MPVASSTGTPTQTASPHPSSPPPTNDYRRRLGQTACLRGEPLCGNVHVHAGLICALAVKNGGRVRGSGTATALRAAFAWAESRRAIGLDVVGIRRGGGESEVRAGSLRSGTPTHYAPSSC
ncbi:hypothetical protein AAFF_G00373410 [Aldrovandia affinis]|uniref:Uncharacterized protein n=1 Tax=Aldrovandia affinis TaxID=143900 RepID=A0AAD7SGG0_9TELE|nr:hypothetical protein AAFF_G00373410 [Aldrovandia affinis]